MYQLCNIEKIRALPILFVDKNVVLFCKTVGTEVMPFLFYGGHTRQGGYG